MQVIANKSEVQFQFKMMTPRRLLKPNAGVGNITVLCNMFPDIDEEGNLQSLMSCITDVSDLKDLEEQLRTRTREAEHQIDHVLILKKQQEDFIDVRQTPSSCINLPKILTSLSDDLT